MKLNTRALTFIEVNLAVILIAILSFTIYSSLSSGMKIWKSQVSSNSLVDCHILFDAITRDLRNVLDIGEIKPEGSKESVSFACFFEPGRQSGSGFGKTSYWFDKSKKAVYRKYEDFSDILNKDKTAGGSLIAKDITDFSVSYYYIDEPAKNGQWRSQIGGSLARAVKIDISYKENKRSVSLTKIVPLKIQI